MNSVLIILIEYIIIAIAIYILLNHVELTFYKKDGEEIEPSPKLKKLILIRISLFWIITIPAIVIRQWRGN